MSNGIDERMNYAMMEEMAHLFIEAARMLDVTIDEAQQVASTLEGGALLGKTGEALTQALRVDLVNSLDKLRDKMTELSDDIMGAVQYERDAVATAKSRFI